MIGFLIELGVGFLYTLNHSDIDFKLFKGVAPVLLTSNVKFFIHKFLNAIFCFLVFFATFVFYFSNLSHVSKGMAKVLLPLNLSSIDVKLFINGSYIRNIMYKPSLKND